MKKTFFLLIFAFIGTVCSISNAQTIHYVKPNGTGNGSSWANAAGNIQDMIDASAAGDQVWVAAGTYIPTYNTGTEHYTKTFMLKDGVHLYGGFAGNETSISARAKSDKDGNGKVEPWEFTNETILYGRFEGTTIVYLAQKLVSMGYPVAFVMETQFDGFSVTNGATGIASYGKNIINNCIVKENRLSCGIYNDVDGIVSNCYITHNYNSIELSTSGTINNKYTRQGGGIFNLGVVKNCVVSWNECEIKGGIYKNGTYAQGGGIYNDKGIVINCIFEWNRCYATTVGSYSTHAEGGGIYNNGGVVRNCILSYGSCLSYQSNKYCYAYGGGIHNYGGTVSNCLVYKNHLSSYDGKELGNWEGGAGIYSGNNSNPGNIYCSTVINNTIYNSTSDNIYIAIGKMYNCIHEDDNLKQNFIDPFEGDFRLKPGSPYIEAGSLNNLPDWIINGTDLAGKPRVTNGKISLGAYEFDPNIGIDELNLSIISFVVFPNPAQTELFIKSDLEIEKVEIYSIMGTLLRVENNFKEKISVSDLPKGIYFLKVRTDEGVVNRKFVKE